MSKSRIVIFPRRSPVPSSARTSGGMDLSPGLLEKARGRVAFLAMLLFIMTAIGLVINVLLFATDIFTRTEAFSDFPVLLICGGLWYASRSPRISSTKVLRAALASEVVLCFAIALAQTKFNLERFGDFPIFTPSTILILVFPLLIPAPPRKVIIVTVAAVLMEPLSRHIAGQFMLVQPSAFDLAASVVGPIFGGVLAVFGARVVWGMSLDATKAERLGSYQLESRLGAGGMGEVWRARHRLLARPAAIKLIRPEVLGPAHTAGSVRTLKRFRREAEVTATLNSLHTVELFDFGITEEGTFYYVMELLEGIDLERLVERYGPQPAERVAAILLQVCDSLADAHSRGLVHRDIKPANIFVCRKGLKRDVAKVLDFGLVALLPDRAEMPDVTKLSQEGFSAGTPTYMSPEVALAAGELDGRTDLYSLGAVAYWLLTGRPVFERESPMATIVAHCREVPVPPSQVAELPIPKALEDIVMACLAKEPSDRPESAEVVINRLTDSGVADAWTQVRALAWWERHKPESSPPDADAKQGADELPNWARDTDLAL